jgi:hypothetical protein
MLSPEQLEKVPDSRIASWNELSDREPAWRIGTAFLQNVEQSLIRCNHDIRIEKVCEKLRVAGRTRGYLSKALGKGMGPTHPLSWDCAFVGQMEPEFHPCSATEEAIIKFHERCDPVAIGIANLG